VASSVRHRFRTNLIALLRSARSATLVPASITHGPTGIGGSACPLGTYDGPLALQRTSVRRIAPGLRRSSHRSWQTCQQGRRGLGSMRGCLWSEVTNLANRGNHRCFRILPCPVGPDTSGTTSRRGNAHSTNGQLFQESVGTTLREIASLASGSSETWVRSA